MDNKEEFMKYAEKRIREKKEVKEKGKREALNFTVESMARVKKRTRAWK